MRLAFFGSSILSSYWNGAATYYRGIVHALHELGVETTFFEPDAYGRQQRRDMDPPPWVEVVVYQPDAAVLGSLRRRAAEFDVIVKASGIGVLDDELLEAVAALHAPHSLKLYWDVDAPATLCDLESSPGHVLRRVLPSFDGVLTYGGGSAVVGRFLSAGARRCVPVYNALDPRTHHRVAAAGEFACDLAFLGNRLPDREERVNEFLFEAARLLPERKFILAGAGWEPERVPPNVRVIGHLATKDHNAFNSSALAVLNISRSSMASAGFSPATRVFEAAGAAACIITDRWDGIDVFLREGAEILVADSGRQVAEILCALSEQRARQIGRQAQLRVLEEHTYQRRGRQVVELLSAWRAQKCRTGEQVQ